MQFGSLNFEIKDEEIRLVGHGGTQTPPFSFAEVQICGENKPTHIGAKTAKTSEGVRWKYVSHEIKGNTLIVTQRSEKAEVKTFFEQTDGANVLRIVNEVKNISEEEIVLEEVAFCLKGLFNADIDQSKEVFFTKFYQSHHQECQPRRFSLFDVGFSRGNDESQHRLTFANIGSQSTKEELPQGILEYKDRFCMFQIESNHSWVYELGDIEGKYYLTLGTAEYTRLNWAKKLNKGETYTSEAVAITFGSSLSYVIGEMAEYRKTLIHNIKADEKQPVIFNEYMYLSWDSPDETRTKTMAQIAKNAGADVYVIDCGWHNEEPGNVIYPYVGQWKQSKARFPHGVRAVTDYIRSFGMKAGLWIEPEVVGIKCKEMLDYYDKDCFVQRFGKPVTVARRLFLDYRNEKVRKYMTETIRRMVEEYGAEYIKFDYNQDMGVGTDFHALTAGEGLESISQAYLNWVDEIRLLFPNVIFENCSSGGMRLDYKSLSRFHLTSTSDCTSYENYPYISANLSTAVLPRQAGIWCYPVANLTSSEEISDDRIVVNVVNCLLGRMCLAGNLTVLNETQFTLLQEGVALYKKLNEVREKGAPYLPMGLFRRGDGLLVSGLKTQGELYLCVWNMDKKECVEIELEDRVKTVEVLYPSALGVVADNVGSKITIRFENVRMAAFLKAIREIS